MEKKKKNIKKNNVFPYSVCSSCDYFQNCSYVKNNVSPLYFCEEFSNYIYNKEKIEKENKNKLISLYELGNIENRQLKGLCMNCENNKKCKNYKPDIGIWHCEEYI